MQAEFLEFSNCCFTKAFIPGSEVDMAIKFGAQFFDNGQPNTFIRTGYLSKQRGLRTLSTAIDNILKYRK